MSFRMPPLQLQVSSLRGVPGWAAAHPKGFLLPEDVRRDAMYQQLARRNVKLRRAGWACAAFAVAGFALAGALWLRGSASANVASQASAPLSAMPVPAATASPATAPAPAASLPRVVAAEASAAPAASAGKRFTVPAIASASAPAARGLPRVVSAAAKPGAKETASPSGVSAAASRERPAPRTTPRAPDAVDAAAGAGGGGDVISITDFFGVNSAVMLSSNGGQSVRTYRVGDALPNGEVITVIDTNKGSVTTNRRTIKK